MKPRTYPLLVESAFGRLFTGHTLSRFAPPRAIRLRLEAAGYRPAMIRFCRHAQAWLAREESFL